MGRLSSGLHGMSCVMLDGGMPLSTRLAFTARYSVDMLRICLTRTDAKKVHFLNGEDFRYSGNHKNLLVDHIAEHIRAYRRCYERAEVVLDVGASFGTFALLVNYYNPRARIYSFEASHETFGVLSSNCRDQKNIEMLNQAVGDSEGEVVFRFDRDYPEGSRVIRRDSCEGEGDCVEGQVCLDRCVGERGIEKVDLLKIDTEGYELEELEGAKETLGITSEVIVETDCEIGHLMKLLTAMGERQFRLTNLGSINVNHEKGEIGSLDLIFRRGP